jgi:NitT/TauT family transport system substrate-binding protein
MFNFRRRSLITLLLSAPLLLLAGCTDAGSSAPGVSAGSGITNNAGPVTLRLAYFPNVTHAAALYGAGKGTFAEALKGKATVEERVFTAGPAEIEALFAGEVDLGYIGPGPALTGYLKSGGKALKIIAGASSGGAALVARPDVGIASLKDLAGKRVAVPQTGGTQDISLRHALKTAGLTPREKGGTVDVVQYAPADTLTQFRLKAIDAAWVPEPWVARLEKEAGAKVVLEEDSLWPGGKFSTAVVIARTEFLEKHPDVVAAFLKAHVSAVEAIKKDPDAARTVIGERIKTLSGGKAIPEPILKTALERTEITYDALPESILTFADWSKELGYLRQDRTALTALFAREPLQVALANGKAP